MTNGSGLGKTPFMSESNSMPDVVSKTIARNEPCPCGSRKKYKRCCGVSAAPQLSVPKQTMGMPSGGNEQDMAGQNFLDQFDPQMLSQMTQAFQRLPKGQLQRMQSLMQKAMNGRDITAESQEFEKSLPPDFQALMKSWAPAAGMPGIEDAVSQKLATQQDSASISMTEERARELVAQAAAEGAISKEQAEKLLASNAGDASSDKHLDSSVPSSTDLSDAISIEFPQKTEQPQTDGVDAAPGSKLGRFWKNLAGKKTP